MIEGAAAPSVHLSAPTPTLTPAPTPPEADATQDDPAAERPITRNATSASEAPHNFLSLPYSSQRVRDIYAPTRDRIRRSSINRTPSPRPEDDAAFDFPPSSSSMDEATVQRLMEAAIRAT